MMLKRMTVPVLGAFALVVAGNAALVWWLGHRSDGRAAGLAPAVSVVTLKPPADATAAETADAELDVGDANVEQPQTPGTNPPAAYSHGVVTAPLRPLRTVQAGYVKVFIPDPFELAEQLRYNPAPKDDPGAKLPPE
jgi:hypothetical protein